MLSTIDIILPDQLFGRLYPIAYIYLDPVVIIGLPRHFETPLSLATIE